MYYMRTLKLIPLLLATLTSCGKSSSGSGGDGGSLPKLSVADISVSEGSGGTGTVEINCTLDHGYSRAVTVSWATQEGTAKAGTDFTAASGQTITFQPN